MKCLSSSLALYKNTQAYTNSQRALYWKWLKNTGNVITKINEVRVGRQVLSLLLLGQLAQLKGNKQIPFDSRQRTQRAWNMQLLLQPRHRFWLLILSLFHQSYLLPFQSTESGSLTEKQILMLINSANCERTTLQGLHSNLRPIT